MAIANREVLGVLIRNFEHSTSRMLNFVHERQSLFCFSKQSQNEFPESIEDKQINKSILRDIHVTLTPPPK